jgi:3',5'-nucleoside bisphosphate phosphatase
MSQYIDLHMHTNFSDGTSSPAELLAAVNDAGLVAFSVTDHDTVDGLREVMRLRTESHPKLISGVELSVNHNGNDVHMLGYGFDIDNKALNDTLLECAVVRDQRGRLMVDKLQSLGLNISFEQVAQIAGGGVVGRPHIADAMLKSGAVKSYEESFYKYIGTGKPAYVAKKMLLPRDAIDLLHSAGGVAVLAHPVLENTWRLLDDLIADGLDGIEVYHAAHAEPDIDRFRDLARRNRLVMTGGSDYHGRVDSHGAIGSQKVPADILAELERAIKERRKQT